MICKLILGILFVLLIVFIAVIIYNSKKPQKQETFSIENGIVSSLCNNKGYVSNLENNRCQCIDGWSGDKCEFSNCSGQGTLSGGVCNCNPGYKGTHCQYSDKITCNGNGTVDNNGRCYCNPNSHGRFCNNVCLNGGKGVNNKCQCKKEKMFFKDDNNTNSAYKMVDLYTGNNCENIVVVKDVNDIENIYMDELPSDEKNENAYILKICPFNKNIEITNMKVNGIVISRNLDNTVKDNNDCYIINPSFYVDSYVPDCYDRYAEFGNMISRSSNDHGIGSTFEGLCSPVKISALIGQDVTCTFDVISKNTNKKESGKVRFVTAGLEGSMYPGAPGGFGDSNVTVNGLSNFYVRKGVADAFLSEGSIIQNPIEAIRELHLPHDPNARAYNLIVGEPIDTCSCTGKNCGDDGCGGSCGICEEGSICNNGVCCTPNCSGKSCGDNGCGGSCGTCPNGVTCNNGICCNKNCAGKKCGDDGCGGSCGTCTDSSGNKLTCYSGPAVTIPIGNKINPGVCICNTGNDPQKDNCVNFKPLIKVGEQNGSKWIIFTNNTPYKFIDIVNNNPRLQDSNDTTNGQSFSYVPKMKLKDPKNNQYSYLNVEPDDNSFIIIHVNIPYANKYGMNDLGQWDENDNSDSFTFNPDKGIYESVNTSTIIYQDMS